MTKDEEIVYKFQVTVIYTDSTFDIKKFRIKAGAKAFIALAKKSGRYDTHQMKKLK